MQAQAAAAGHRHRRRGQLFQRLLLAMVEPGLQGLCELAGGQCRQPRLAGQERCQPLLQPVQQRIVGKIGQDQLRPPLRQAAYPRQPLVQCRRPGQGGEPELAHAIEQAGQALRRIDLGQAFALQHQRHESAFPKDRHRLRVRVEPALFAGVEMRGETLLQLVRIKRRRQPDQAVARVVTQVGDHQPGLAAQG